MNKTLRIATLVLLAYSLFIPAAYAAAGQHPRITQYSHRWVYDWDLRESVYELTMELVSDGIDVVPVTVIFRSVYPETGAFTTQTIVRGSGTIDQTQLNTFKAYVPPIYGCNDASPAAHVYDSASTINPASPITLVSFAQALGQLRYQSFGCSDLYPPPLGECSSSAAPQILSFDPDSVSFYYTTIRLDNGNSLTLGFEYDGDEWSFAEQYGSVGACQTQLTKFVNYNLAILTSSSCAAAQVYTPAEEATIAWYVGEVENACQNNQ